ncbi:MAG TPA: MMPL family transporter [Rhizomicrobium sp.]|jgi:hypothetical protein
MRSALIGRVVAFCVRYAAFVVSAVIALGFVAGFETVLHFALNSDTSSLISASVPWRQRDIAFDRAFPGTDGMTLVVIDGATPEVAEGAAQRLKPVLAANKALIRKIRDIQDEPLFAQDGLLFLPLADVKKTTQQLITAQPFLGPLAQDPSLRGLMDALSTALLGVQHGQAKLSDLKTPMVALSDAFGRVEDGKTAFLSWQTLIGGGKADPSRNRRIIQVYGAQHFGQLTPGAQTSAFIRQAARRLHLDPAHGVTVRLSGPVPLADEEFATLAERAGLMVTLMIAFILASLWLAVRSWRIILCIVSTLLTGLAITTALGLVFLGTFNVISIAFIPLFAGIGVDFGIQFSVRYRAERRRLDTLDGALVRAGEAIGTSLSLAAAATGAAFFSFLPTNYAGVAQLGLVAGVGMIVAFTLAVTLLPALLKLVRPQGEAEEIGFAALAPLDRWLIGRRRIVFATFGMAAVAAAVSVPLLRFDSNPMDLRSATTESVATLLDLFKNPDTSPNTIDVLAPSLAEARKVAARLARLPEVERVITLESFIPEQQTEKLAVISDASMLLDTTLAPFTMKPPPNDAQTVESLRATAKALRDVRATDVAMAPVATRFADVLDRLANGAPALRQKASDAVVPGLKVLLSQLSGLLSAQPVTLASMPADFRRDWLTPDGRARVEAVPRGDSNNNDVLAKFSAAVRSVAPDANGEPISVAESGDTIVAAFIEAGILSLLVLIVLLAIVLRSLRDVLLAVIPLATAGLLTLGTCAAIGLQLNFANIIALPLLFGLGVSFDIYFVMAARRGERHLLQSSLARAVLFSAMTTATGFGALWISSHPGTASMGELLMISLAWTLVSVLLLLPALVGD